MFKAIFVVLSLITTTLGCFEKGIDYHGHDLNPGRYVSTSSANACQSLCQQTSGCTFWTWDPGYKNACWMKKGQGAKTHNARVTSGPRTCGGPPTPSSCFDKGVDYWGHDLKGGQFTSTPSASACQTHCQQTPGCNFWTWDPGFHNACWKKTAKGPIKHNAKLTSGPRTCGGNTPNPPAPPPSGSSLRLMSYNMYGWNALRQNPWKAQNMYKIIRDFNPDILSVQEEEGMANSILNGIGGGYGYSPSKKDGHVIFFKHSKVKLDGHGNQNISPKDQWGQRSVDFAHFTDLKSGKKIDVFNTHWCVCGAPDLLRSAQETLAIINSKRRHGSTVILTGDLNVFPGFENTDAVKYLKSNGLEDTFRKVNGGNGSTFGAAGKIDYIFASSGTVVTSAQIDKRFNGQASDHYAINAVIKV